MPERLKYHFEPKKGWINDPNGLIFFKGRYHAFFQHNPYEPKWGPMHWGHAVSEDLIHWEEYPIALTPDKPYENSGGCFSGSAVEKDGRLYLFYTSVSHELNQTQSVATSEDGIHFEKYKGNPVIARYPEEGSADFRDPKVTKIGDRYYMVCGSGRDGIGKILFFESFDLYDWKYDGVLFEGAEYGPIFECPDFFPMGDKYVLMFSKVVNPVRSTQFVLGDFRGNVFTPLSYCTPEAGPHFYAPQTFLDDKNRRIMIGWLYNRQGEPDEGADYAGAFSIPRELKLMGNTLLNYPVSEARHLLVDGDPLLSVTGDTVTLAAQQLPDLKYTGSIRKIEVLRDTKTIEVFINSGEASFTYWFGK